MIVTLHLLSDVRIEFAELGKPKLGSQNARRHGCMCCAQVSEDVVVLAAVVLCESESESDLCVYHRPIQCSNPGTSEHHCTLQLSTATQQSSGSFFFILACA